MRWLNARSIAASMRRPRLRRTLSAAGFLLMGACAAPGPSEVATSRTYPGIDRQALYERTVAALRASDLNVTATDPANGVVRAAGSFEDRNWAECSPARLFVEDSDDRHYLVTVPDKDRRVQLQASVSDRPQGARLTLAPAFTAEPVSPMATTPRCRTSGALERQIFEAVANE
jgi:hypothetical protein